MSARAIVIDHVDGLASFDDLARDCRRVADMWSQSATIQLP